MADSRIILPQESYWRYLETVGGIKFTPREIEVISCLYETRLKTKEIAAFLFIAPKTVRAHITNIMGKMDCSSREAIIEFIKKSGQSSRIKNHYLALRISSYFEKQLKRIRLPAEKQHCEIIDWVIEEGLLNSKLQKSLKNQLKEHLELVSITVKQTTKNGEDFIQYREVPKHSSFHIGCKVMVKQLQTRKGRAKIEIYQLTQIHPDNAIFLLVDRKMPMNLLKEMHDGEITNYYFAVFDMLLLIK